MEKRTLQQQFSRARVASAPLVAIQTSDATAAMAEIVNSYEKAKIGFIVWDAARGARGLNRLGEASWLKACGGDKDAAANTINPIEFLLAAAQIGVGNEDEKSKNPEDVVVFALNLHQFMLGGAGNDDAPSVVTTQGFWNLRDIYKRRGIMLVIVGQEFKFSADVLNDIVILDQPLADDKQLRDVLDALISANAKEIKVTISEETRAQAVSAVRGNSRFMAEQLYSMNISTQGLDIEGLWESSRKATAQFAGLTHYDGPDTLEDVGGCEGIKTFLMQVTSPDADEEDRPVIIVRLDELEKHLAGATKGTSDSSGVSQGVLGALLTFMAENNTTGLLFVGHGGTAKSAICRAAANSAGLPLIEADLGAMKDSLVGSTERNTRAFLRRIKAMSGGRVLFIATCNDITKLPPELKRRFSLGRFMFDLPTPQELEKIWPIWKAKKRLADADHSAVNCKDWTGDEVRRCCDIAKRLRIPLIEAANYIVPVAVSDADRVEQLRQEANGKYLNSADGKVYEWAGKSDLGFAGEAASLKQDGRKLRRAE